MLSLTVKRKFKVLATVGNISEAITEPCVNVDPDKMLFIVGKYLTGEVTGLKVLNKGPVVFVLIGVVVVAFP